MTECDLPDEMEASIENLRLVAEHGSCRVFVWGKTQKDKAPLLVDMQTASLAVQVYDKLKESNKEKAAAMIAKSNPAACRFFEFCWKAVSK